MKKKYAKNGFRLSLPTYPNTLTFPNKKHLGLIKIETGRILHQHEFMIINKLLCFGHDIFCQTESKLMKTADIVWQDEVWEMKRITGTSRDTIIYNLRKAKRQNSRVILDLSDSPITIQRSLGKIIGAMHKHKTILKVFIISKNEYCVIDRSVLK